jgi:site-specific DNA recombinase
MTPGAIYCRISRDAEGLALGVDRQREDCITLAAQHDIDVPEDRILIENDVGASTKSRKARPQYDKLRRLVEEGTVHAVVFYSNSRLTRRPMELEDWIVLHDKTGVRLVSKVSGNDDLGTADGRMVARIKASVDAAEAERISERVKRSLEQSRAAGKVGTGGPRPFGFTASSQCPDLVPEEAEAIRHGASMLLSGATYGQVAAHWTERGVRPVRAKSWTRESVRSVYRSARLAGLVVHEGRVVAEGAFPAILDRATWEAVVEAVRHGAPRPAGYGARVHVLAGFVFCGICGATMVAQGEQHYRCVKQRQGCGGVKRNKLWLDTLMDGYVRGKLAQGDSIEVTSASPEVDDVDELERKIDTLRTRHVEGLVDDEDFFPLLSGLRAKLNAARKAQAEVVRAATQKAALHDPLGAWEDGDLTAKRAVLAGLVQGVYVKPLGRIGRAPIPVDSVQIVEAKTGAA